MQQEQTTPSIFDEIRQQNPVTYATTGQRFANFIVDSIVIRIAAIIINVGIMILIQQFAPDINETNSVGYVLFLLLTSFATYILFYTLLERLANGKTLGKLITKTRVVREDSQPLTWKDTLIRSLCRLVPFETFSGLSGYPWHDKWTKTLVVKEEDRPNF